MALMAFSAFLVVDAKAGAIVVAQIELGKGSGANGLRSPDDTPVDAAFRYGEKVLGSVDVREAAEAGILVSRMVRGAMAGVFPAKPRIDNTLVSHQCAGTVGGRHDDRVHDFSVDARHMERGNATVALDRRQDGFQGKHEPSAGLDLK
jgi:hypothetical protein